MSIKYGLLEVRLIMLDAVHSECSAHPDWQPLMCVPGACKVLTVQVCILLADFVVSFCDLIPGPDQEGPISSVLSQQPEC